ncbi:MAG: hypothetical protein HC902_06985 [Calothrix sp. SM1_5_4]|nr:hypothetical protein [Calothrix sp. SM1_5_4]
MKNLLLAVIVSLAGPMGWADPEPSLRDHMRAMGYLMDEIFSRAKETKNYQEAAQKARDVRAHLVKAIALEPDKFRGMRETEKNAARIEYHKSWPG